MALTRNAAAVNGVLKKMPDGKIVATENCMIQVPSRFFSIGLGEFSDSIFIYGLFPLILESGFYSVCNIMAMVEIVPDKIKSVIIDEEDYKEFYFDAGSTVIKTEDLLKNDKLLFNVIDELFFKGKIPWFVEYNDLGKLLETSSKHAGTNVGDNLELCEFLASLVTRSKKDRTKYIRCTAASMKDFQLSNIDYIPLNSVFYSVTSTSNKLIGSYFRDGLVSALVSPSNRVDNVEGILRA